MLETALACHALGYPVVFVPPGEKGPRGSGWQNERLSETEIRKRWGNFPDANCGIILGPPSGIIDVEGDSPESPADLIELFGGDVPETPSWQARRGVHRLFQWDDRLADLGAVIKWRSVEIRLGNKAAQSLLPPSVTDGFKRSWIVPLGKPAALPDAVIEKIIASGGKQDTQAVPLDASRPGDDFDLRGTWAEIVLPHGWTQIGSDQWCRPGKSGAVSASTECKSEAGRSLFHCFTSNAPPLEQDRSYSKFGLYAALNHNADFHAAAADLTAKGFGKRPLFDLITSRQLATSRYTTEFLIDKTLVAGQPCVIAGPKKALKTSLIIDMAVALATGGNFLGRLPVRRPCRVLVMSGESGLATIQETASRVALAGNRQLADMERLTWCVNLPRFGDEAHLAALREILPGTDVLVVDPAYLAMPSVDNANLFSQGELLRQMNDVCQPLGVTLILAHHTKKTGKADQSAPPELEEIAWAGFQEWARQWLLIGRREKYEPGTGEHRLWLNVGGSAGHSALWALDVSEGIYDPETPRRWDVSLTTADDARQEVNRKKRGNEKADVLSAMQAFPDGETQSTICGLSGVNNRLVGGLLRELVIDGAVVPCQIRKAGRLYPAFKLTEIQK